MPRRSCRLSVAHDQDTFGYEFQAALVGINHDMVSGQHFGMEELQGQRILHLPLEGTSQWPRPAVQIEGLGRQQILGGIRKLQTDFAVAQQTTQVFKA